VLKVLSPEFVEILVSIISRPQFGGEIMVQTSITVPSLVEGSLTFHVSFCLWCFCTTEIVLTTSPTRRWNIEKILVSLDRHRFVVVHPCSTFFFLRY